MFVSRHVFVAIERRDEGPVRVLLFLENPRC